MKSGQKGVSVNSGKTSLSVHMGGTLKNLARFYPDMASVVDEMIQNALDAGATLVQLRVNQKTRFIAIRDNGRGMSQQAFEKRVSQSIGHTLKSEEDLGQFGIGAISAWGKCQEFSVTSCPAPRKEAYVTWTFPVDSEASGVSVDWRERKDLRFAPDQVNVRSGQNVWWRTAIEIKEYVKDRALSEMTMKGILESATMKYSSKMERLGTRLRVDFVDYAGNESSAEVAAAKFTGTRLPERRYYRESSGEVIVRMYLAKRHDSRGRVNIKFGEAGNDFRFPFSHFRTSSAKELLDSRVMEALGSGIFEGEVLGELVQLTPSRTCFERNDAMIDLCVSLETWFREEGEHYLDEQRRVRQSERYQEIGHYAHSRLDRLFRESPRGEDLKAALSRFRYGSIGLGHSERETTREQEEKSKAITGSQKKVGGEGSKRSQEEAIREHDEPHLTSRGPNGSKRRLVQGGSHGLQFAYDEMPDSPKLWELDLDEGVIVFNTMHPDWVECDRKGESNWRLCSLLVICAIQALSLLAMPDQAMWPHQRKYADTVTGHLASWLVMGGGMPLGRRA